MDKLHDVIHLIRAKESKLIHDRVVEYRKYEEEIKKLTKENEELKSLLATHLENHKETTDKPHLNEQTEEFYDANDVTGGTRSKKRTRRKFSTAR